eukprot:TRINITY_DN26863_c0_g1_i4.p1 TRINITY_DN26863_c0_g1~~TRINITY_DN26863_c0_g1_i4.p1  ORF type:complete len:213 (-),score=44.30 TRINITY_DN26863_c0_g1_i4:316-954(-)
MHVLTPSTIPCLHLRTAAIERWLSACPRPMDIQRPGNGPPIASSCSTRLLVAPLRYGAGVKGKLTDSMRYGLVTVTTAVATEGLGGVEGYPGIVVSSCADDDEDAHASAFAEAIVQAYQDQERWEALQNRGLEFVDEHLSSKSVGAKLAAFLQEKWQSLPEARNKDYFGQMLWQNSLRSTQWMAKYIETKEELRQLKARRSQSEDNASAGAS